MTTKPHLVTGQRDDPAVVAREDEGEPDDLDRRRVNREADQRKGGCERESIRGACLGNTAPQMPQTSDVLHRREETGREDADQRTGTKRTRSPARKSTGGSAAGSYSRIPDRPSRRQPPGESLG